MDIFSDLKLTSMYLISIVKKPMLERELSVDLVINSPSMERTRVNQKKEDY